MSEEKYCIKFTSYQQTVDIIKILKQNKISPIFFINYNLIDHFGIDWLNELREMLEKKYSRKDFKIYAEVKKNYGFFISLVEKKINYIKVRADEGTLKRLLQISKLNKVSINPDFSVVDLSKSKNIINKLKKYYKIQNR